MVRSKSARKVLADCITFDDDGLAFIDYLRFMQTVLRNDDRSYYQLLEKHKQLIDRNLVRFENNKRVISKYLWLRKYHNATVRATIGTRQRKKLIIKALGINSQIPSLTT
jgi:hypothetical protein